MRVERLTTAETHALRRLVLRENDPLRSVSFDGDDRADTIHWGIRGSGGVVATSTWIPNPCPEHPDRRSMQLRGMAITPDLQGRGIGTMVLVHGIEHAVAAAYEVVWANARDTALRFYDQHGFHVFGDGYIDPTTRLPHHVVVRIVTE